MRKRLLNTLVLLALAGASATVLAQEAPGRVGRIALTQGTVSVSIDGGEHTAAQVNWPVTSREMITTARGARTELQVGAAFIRLDGDTSLEVLQLDDDNLRLHLHYGSASIRVLDADTLAGFELSTPEGRVTLQEPGEMRIDAERVADTSSVTVLHGVAHVEGGGASLILRAGKRAEIRDDDVSTLAATRDGFDDWVQGRDRVADAPTATRYVSPDMTGYADLDRYGSWHIDPEYGALWTPLAVPAGWVPYSDGSWVWLDPWGWTWVDNAPWGYAPFHYGRWVFAHNHWGWAPGHREHHPVWSPALVGWVGGGNWSAGFRLNDRHQPMPARGWYPLTPHERFEPGYHVRDDHLRRLNGDVHPDPRHRGEEHRGVTVVPQEQFGQHGRVPVANVPHTTVPPQVAQRAPGAAPPAPPPNARFHDRDGRGQERRGDEHGGARDAQPQERGDHRRDWQARNPAGEPVLTAPAVPQNARAPEPQERREHRGEWQGRNTAGAPAVPQAARAPEQRPPQPAQAAAVMPVPAQPAPPQWRDRRDRVDEERHAMPERFERRHEQPAPVAAAPSVSQFPVPQPVVPHYQTMPAPAPVVPQQQPMQAPPPVVPQQRPVFPAAAQPAPAAAPAQGPRREEHHGDRRDERRQQDR
ncbi:MAG: DUF6600 domain-containing protein [Telluria sp.]